MKKFLSLVLALVMTMSLVTISAGAKDFTDGDTVTYNEAIDVMSALKVVDGYPDGSFKPTTQLNRGQAAKILCNMILGPTTASALKADAAPFKDVAADSTFAAYIAFCAKEGIIDGYTDGTFKPTAPLTGYAFMKLLLGALGYDKDIEGYNQPNWSINVAKRALAIGLADGLKNDFDGTKIVTREEACLYALNTLTANMVDYDSKTTVSVNGAEVVIGNTNAWELSQGTIYKDNMNKAGLQFAEKYFTDLKLTANSSDDFGRPANTWKVKGDKVGTYPKTPDLTYSKEIKGKAIYGDLDKKVANSDIEVYVDGKLTASAIALDKNNGTKVGKLGSTTEVFYDDDASYYGTDEVVIATVNYYFAEVLGDYDTKDEEVTLAQLDSSVAGVHSWTVSSDDVAGLEDLKDGDKVIFTMAWNGTDYDIKTVTVCEPVVAAVTEYTVPTAQGEGSVTAGGETYSYNYTYTNNTRTYELKDDYKLYLDMYGNVIYADGVEAEGNYFFVTEYVRQSGLKNGQVVADIYTLDGANETVTLNKVNNTAVANMVIPTVNNPINQWYSFREKTSGKYDITYKTTVGGTFGADTAKAIENGKGGMQIPTVGTVRVTNATIFIINDKNDNVKVYTGIKNVPTIDADGTSADKTSIYAMVDGNYAKFVFVDLGNGHVKGSKNSDMVYFLKATREDDYSQDVDDNTYYTYKAILNGEEKKVKVEASVPVAVGLFTDVVYSNPGYIDGITTLNYANTHGAGAYADDFTVENIVAQTLKRSGDVLTTADNTVSFYLADGATAIIIKANGDIDTTTSARSLSSTYKTTALTATVTAVLNADGEATTLYIQK